MLHSRAVRGGIPKPTNRLKPSVQCHRGAIKARKKAIKEMKTAYDRGSQRLQSLKIGESVRIQPSRLGKVEWEKATVTQKLPYRQYELRREDGIKCKRNRKHLRKEAHPRGTQEKSETGAETKPGKEDSSLERRGILRPSQLRAKEAEEAGNYQAATEESEGIQGSQQWETEHNDGEAVMSDGHSSEAAFDTADEEETEQAGEEEDQSGPKLRDRSKLRGPDRYR